MKKISSEEFKEKAMGMERIRKQIGKAHDQLGKLQEPTKLKTSQIIQGIVGCLTYPGPVDLGLTLDLNRTTKLLAEELDRRIPIPGE